MVRWSPLSRGFVRAIVQEIRPDPVYTGKLGTKLGTRFGGLIDGARRERLQGRLSH